MSGPGDIGGEVSGDEAAWRDLIARFDVQVDLDKAEHPWPSVEDVPGTSLGAPSSTDQSPGDRADPLTTTDHADRVIHIAGPRNYSPPEEEDEQYVPEPLPPPARLDPMAKAAWVAVIGGPAYLLIAGLFMNLTVSPVAAFIAVGAFIGGFVTLIVKGGDRSRRDDDDDGAVL
jgi:hypothetical protein